MSALLDGRSMLIAHEWLAKTGGSENCYEQLLAEFPGATSAVLWNDAPQRFGTITHETWLARSPLRRTKMGALPFMPSAWRQLPLGDAEVVLASTHMFAHVLASRAAREGRAAFCYVHTPLRYVWAPEADHRGNSFAARTVSRALRPYDRCRADSRVQYAANSEYVRRRVETSWNQDAYVINPCVDVERAFSPAPLLGSSDGELLSKLPDTFILGVSRMVEYKRLDIVIDVGAELSEPVVVVGSGPDLPRLKAIAASAGIPVHFVGRVSDAVLEHLYRRAAALIFPPIEDFGIVPVESIARGTPVVVGPQGGAREAVERTGGGAVADGPGVDSFVAATRDILGSDMTTAIESARYFSNARFRSEVRGWLER